MPRRLPDGRLVIPRRAEGPGGIIGDGIDVIGPGDELYDWWEPRIALRERRAQEKTESDTDPGFPAVRDDDLPSRR